VSEQYTGVNFTTGIHLEPYGKNAWNYASIPLTCLPGVHRQNFITNTIMNRHKEKKKNGRRGGRSKPNVTFRITKTPKLFISTSV